MRSIFSKKKVMAMIAIVSLTAAVLFVTAGPASAQAQCNIGPKNTVCIDSSGHFVTGTATGKGPFDMTVLQIGGLAYGFAHGYVINNVNVPCGHTYKVKAVNTNRYAKLSPPRFIAC